MLPELPETSNIHVERRGDEIVLSLRHDTTALVAAYAGFALLIGAMSSALLNRPGLVLGAAPALLYLFVTGSFFRLLERAEGQRLRIGERFVEIKGRVLGSSTCDAVCDRVDRVELTTDAHDDRPVFRIWSGTESFDVGAHLTSADREWLRELFDRYLSAPDQLLDAADRD